MDIKEFIEKLVVASVLKMIAPGTAIVIMRENKTQLYGDKIDNLPTYFVEHGEVFTGKLTGFDVGTLGATPALWITVTDK